jgi:hypothetical protein
MILAQMHCVRSKVQSVAHLLTHAYVIFFNMSDMWCVFSLSCPLACSFTTTFFIHHSSFITHLLNQLTLSLIIFLCYEVFSRKRRSTVGIKALLETGRGEYLKNFEMGLKKIDRQGTVKEKVLIQVASFLHRELPIRFAHRACQLDAIPLLQTSKHVVEVSSWYKQSFIDIRSVSPPYDRESEEIFSRVIETVFNRHGNTLLTMARGAHDIRTHHFSDTDDFAEFEHIQTELNNFYQSRIDIRTLIGTALYNL